MPTYEDIDLTNVIIDGDPYGEFEGGGGGGGEGHSYDLIQSSDKSETTLTEDGVDKTTLPLVATFVGTRAEWNALSATDKAKYRILHFTDETASVFSHVGQIIESTTLDTEAKVKAIYGANTSWIQHEGYFLRGATSGVVSGTQGQINDGGEDTHTLTASESGQKNLGDITSQGGGQHSHYVARYDTNGTSINAGAIAHYSLASDYKYSLRTAAGSTANWGNTNTVSNHTHKTTISGSDATAAHNNLPKYKNVYIWERVS